MEFPDDSEKGATYIGEQATPGGPDHGHGHHAEEQGTEQAAEMVTATMTPNQVADAYKASLKEHQMKFGEAVRIYKYALFWTLLMGTVRIFSPCIPQSDVVYWC